MTSNEERRLGCLIGTRMVDVVVFTWLALAGALCGEPVVKGGLDAKPGADNEAWRKKLDEMADRTQQMGKGASSKPSAPAPPAPTQGGATPPGMNPLSASGLGVGQGIRALFEDDFDQAGAVSYSQQRMVLLVFAPQSAIDAWRSAPELQSWAQRAVICPVHAGSLGDRAQRLAKAFGIDPAGGGLLTALVRAPDGLQQVTADQLLYQVLGRYPVPRDAADVANCLQEGAAAYELKKGQYAWDAKLATAPAPPAPAAPSKSAGPPPSQPAPAPGAQPAMIRPVAEAGIGAPAPSRPAPSEPSLSRFEKTVMSAWKFRKPILLVFPGNDPFDKAKVAEALQSIPGALSPEHLVLTPGDSEGSIGGKPVNWEEFFNIGGLYPHAVLILPESPGGAAAPHVADMTYRVIARHQGALTPDKVASLVRQWMSEDFDAVTMRAWVLNKPLLLVFPHAEHERELLTSPELAKLEERVAVFVNTRGAVSGIRQKTAAMLEKDLATEGVERPELVLIKLETKKKSAADARLDELIHKPVNRAFAKKTPEKVREWVESRVPADAGATGTKN